MRVKYRSTQLFHQTYKANRYDAVMIALPRVLASNYALNVLKWKARIILTRYSNVWQD